MHGAPAQSMTLIGALTDLTFALLIHCWYLEDLQDCQTSGNLGLDVTMVLIRFVVSTNLTVSNCGAGGGSAARGNAASRSSDPEDSSQRFGEAAPSPLQAVSEGCLLAGLNQLLTTPIFHRFGGFKIITSTKCQSCLAYSLVGVGIARQLLQPMVLLDLIVIACRSQ